MNILVVSRCPPWPLHFGDRLIPGHLLPALRERGHRCDLLAFHQEPIDPEVRSRSEAMCDWFEAIPERPRTGLQYLARLARPYPRRAEHAWNPAMWRAIERRIRARRYDIAHLFGGIQVYEYRHALATLPAIIVPYESHALRLERAVHDSPSTRERLRLRGAWLGARIYERIICRGFERVVVLGDADRDALRRASRHSRIEVIPNGVDVAETARAGREPLMIFVGNFSYEPNARAASILVDAVLPRVRQQVPDARALLVGPSPSDHLLAAARGGAVDVTGWVPDVDPWLARAAVCVAPLTQGAGIKNKILEAMAAGLPVVTTPVGCEGIAAVDGEQVLIASSVDDLAALTVRVLRDPALGRRIGDAARAFVRRHHGWTDVAARYEALYQDVLAETTRQASPGDPRLASSR